MAHKPESEYAVKAISWLESFYGEDNVETWKYLPETYRFVDVYVEGHICDYAIEIENDFEGCLKGIGQALIYGAELDAVPIVITNHIEEPEASMLDSNVKIIHKTFDGENQ